MEVILLETFDRLGQIGDVVKVKNGYARNFLIPQKKALRANKENKEKFLKIKNDLIEKNKKIVDDSKQVLKKIENKEIIFIRNASDNGQLYGSVSPKDIANYFNEKKIDIKPSSINLHSSIKKIGIYDLNIKLHAEVGCNLKINVATSEKNAHQQKIEFENTNIKKKEDSKVEPMNNKSSDDQKSKEESKELVSSIPSEDIEAKVESKNLQSSEPDDDKKTKIELKESNLTKLNDDKKTKASEKLKKESKTRDTKDQKKDLE